MKVGQGLVIVSL